MQMYLWKITLVNGKEYIVQHPDITNPAEMATVLLGTRSDGIMIYHGTLHESDKNGSQYVAIISTHICSFEFCFK